MDNKPSITFQGTSLEARRDTASGTQVVKASQVTQLPPETSMLLAIDQLEDKEVKQAMLEILRRANDKQMEMADRNEARLDKQNEAALSQQNKALWIAAVLFLLVLTAFTFCCLCGVPAACLWAFGIFFVGSAGFFALRRFKIQDK